MFKRFMFLALLVLFSSNTFAEEKKEMESEKKGKDLTKLEEIVVTATRTEKELDSSPGSVNVVTKKDIEKRNIQTVDAALNTTEGVYNQRGKGLLDTSPRIALGGITGYQRTLVLKDGITMNNAYTGNVYWNGLISEDVERIEVVKGPFSSLYGGYAMGGVVNVITRMPEKREFVVKTGYGSAWERGDAPNDLRTFYVSYGDKLLDKLRLFVSYNNIATNGYAANYNLQSSKPTAGLTGWSVTPDRQGNTRYFIGKQGQNDMWSDGGSIKLGYDFSNTTKLLLSYMGYRYNYSYEDPQTFLRNAQGNPVYSYGSVKESSFLSSAGGYSFSNIYNIQFETAMSTAKIKFNLGVTDIPTDYYINPSTTATRFGGPGTRSETESGSYNGDMQVTIPVLSWNIFTVGTSYRQGWSNSTDKTIVNWQDSESPGTISYQSQGKDRTYAVFVQDEITILPNLTAYIGAREDWWETYDGFANQVGTSGYPKVYDNRSASSFSPKGALVYKPFEQTTLRTSAGKAFRPPTVYELYRTTTSSGITYEGAADLKPETSNSWDIGIDQGLWKGAKVKGRYFENYISDLIYAKTVSPTLQQKVNAGKAESKGFELEAEQRFEKWLRLFANFTYTDARIIENNAAPASVGKRMTYMPDKMFNIGADAQFGPVGLNVIGRYISKIYSSDDNSDSWSSVYGSYDDFFTADFKISYKPVSWAEASFSVSNLLDREYYSYYLAPGRSWFLSLTLKY